MQIKAVRWTLGILAIIIIALFAFLIYFFAIKPHIGFAISTCQTDKCVKDTAILFNFNTNMCKRAPTLDLQNKCYYYYQAYNKQSIGTKSTSLCDNIKDVDLIIKCYQVKYKKKVPFLKGSYIDRINWSIRNLDMQLCDKITDLELSKECIDGVVLTKKAIAEKDSKICINNKNFKVSNFARKTCSTAVLLALKSK